MGGNESIAGSFDCGKVKGAIPISIGLGVVVFPVQNVSEGSDGEKTVF